MKSTAVKKALKDYRNVGGSTLLIAVDTSCAPIKDSERRAQLNKLVIELQKTQFRVESVYLIASPHFDIIPVVGD